MSEDVRNHIDSLEKIRDHAPENVDRAIRASISYELIKTWAQTTPTPDALEAYNKGPEHFFAWYITAIDSITRERWLPPSAIGDICGASKTLVTVFGETKTGPEWAIDSRCRLNEYALCQRIRRIKDKYKKWAYWTPEMAIITPKMRN